MIKEGIEKLISIAIPGQVVEINNQQFWAQGEKFHQVSSKKIDALTISDLDALFDYVGQVEMFSEGFSPFIFVSSFDRVQIKTFLNQQKERVTLLDIIYSSFNFPSSSYLPIEDFLVKIQSNFVQDKNLLELMKFLSGIADVAETQVDDNGITQTVKVKAGIVKVGETTIKNPVTLKPCRTFSQIDQPSINYILRLKKIGSGEIGAALFDETSPAWQVETVKKIKEYIAVNLPEKLKNLPIIG